MNYSIDKIVLPSGETRHQLRVWESGRGAAQIKRRFESRKCALDHLDTVIRKDGVAHLLSPLDVKTFGQEYDHWRVTGAKSFAPGWRVNLDGYWKQMREHLESVKLKDVNRALVEKLEMEFLTKGNSLKTVRNKLGLISAVLNHSLETERIPSNPLKIYTLPKGPAPEIEYWEMKDAAGFLAFLGKRHPKGSEGRMIYVACFTALNTAVRAGELWALKPSSLRRSQSSIRVVQQFNRVSKAFTGLKGKEARSVPLSEELMCELDGWFEEKGIGFGDLIFSVEGQPVIHDAFHDLFDREVELWGGPRITFHGLRHTAATIMLSNGIDIKTLQSIMGHKSHETTMKYVHLISESVKKAAENFKILPSPTEFVGLHVVK